MIDIFHYGQRQTMRLSWLIWGSFCIQTVNTVLWNTNSSNGKETYKIVLSNSGPVIPGSKITFEARLQDEHGGLLPADKGEYLFRWSSTADDYKAAEDSDKNSTWRRCFNTFVEPDVYKVEVSVYRNNAIFQERLARKSQEFAITGTLNGNISATQNLRYRRLRKGEPVYSTARNITLKLNLTDSALHESKLYHECDWFLDDKYAGKTTNVTDLVIDSISSTGLHNVTAFLKYFEIPDCDNNTFFVSNRSGLFNLMIDLKDPVEVVNVRGNSDVKLHHALSLGVFYSGSPPFNACWSLQPVANQSDILNSSCRVERQELDQNFTIYMNKTSLVPGQYVINITITNDVSMVEKRHYVTVSDEPLPFHSPANILIPVVGSLIAVTLLLAVTVFIINKRMAKKNVETANFDFHPPTLPILNSGKHEQTLFGRIEGGLFRLFGSQTLTPRVERSSSDIERSQRFYGSCDNTI